MVDIFDMNSEVVSRPLCPRERLILLETPKLNWSVSKDLAYMERPEKFQAAF